jgi:hypothetical protein
VALEDLFVLFFLFICDDRLNFAILYEFRNRRRLRMSVLILRIYQEVLVRSVGPCQTYEGSDVAVTFIDPGLSSTSKRAACVSDRVHALGNHVTCPGIRRHETSSNPGATRRASTFPGFVIRAWVNLLPKLRSGRADGLGRKEANGPATARRAGGDCAAIVLGGWS